MFKRKSWKVVECWRYYCSNTDKKKWLFNYFRSDPPPPPNYSTKLFKMLKKIMKLLDIQQYKNFTVSIRSFKKSWFGIIIHISKVRKGVQDLSEKLWQCVREDLSHLNCYRSQPLTWSSGSSASVSVSWVCRPDFVAGTRQRCCFWRPPPQSVWLTLSSPGLTLVCPLSSYLEAFSPQHCDREIVYDYSGF